MTKRVLAGFLAICMVVGLLAGCGSAQEDASYGELDLSQPIEVEFVTDYDYESATITVSGKQGATDDWNGTVVVGKMKEMFGLTLECNPYSDDEWSTKFNLMLAEDELPDLLLASAATISSCNDNGMDGVYLNFADYFEHMPNLVAYLNAHPDYRAYITAPDGGIYGLTQYTESTLNSIPRNFINRKWLENLDLEYPETADELYDVLKAFKEQDANGNGDPDDEIPMMWSSYARTPEHTLMAMFGIYPAGATANPYYVLQVDDDGQVFLADATENFKAYLKYMNKLWEEGLIYSESYTTEIKVQRELTKNDRVGVFSDASGWTAAGNGNNTDDYYYRSFLGLTSEYNTTPVVVKNSAVGSSAFFVVSASTEYPEEICRMIDYFYSDEGALMGHRGDLASYAVLEDVTIPGLESTSENNWVTKGTPEGYDSWEVYRHKYQTINNAFNVRSLAGDAEEIMLNMTAEELDTIIEYRQADFSLVAVQAALRLAEGNVQIITGYPNMVYDEDISAEHGALAVDIRSYCQTMKAQFITGQLDIDDQWDNFIATLEQMGLERLIEIEQETYDSWYGEQ